MGLWDEFVFPRIAFVPKGEVIKQLIADMQLRPVNVLFVDDNPHNLEEVAYAVPGISVVDARTPECDALLQQNRSGIETCVHLHDGNTRLVVTREQSALTARAG